MQQISFYKDLSILFSFIVIVVIVRILCIQKMDSSRVSKLPTTKKNELQNIKCTMEYKYSKSLKTLFPVRRSQYTIFFGADNADVSK